MGDFTELFDSWLDVLKIDYYEYTWLYVYGGRQGIIGTMQINMDGN